MHHGSKRSILIIGGSGYLGQELIEHCFSKNFNIVSIGKSESHIVSKKFHYISCNIMNLNELRSHLQNYCFDYVVNLGGYVDHSAYFNNGLETFNTHFIGLKNIIESIDRRNLKRFIQIGSSDEYGISEYPQKESQREAPSSAYSASKVLATHYLQMLYREINFPAVILRPFLIYGPRQSNNRLIPQVINACLKGDSINLSPGEQVRDFCHVDDFINIIFKCFENEKVNGEIFNVGSGQAIKIKEVALRIRSIIGKGELNFGAYKYRNHESMFLVADISKSKEILNWLPKVSLKKGLSETINWFKDFNE